MGIESYDPTTNEVLIGGWGGIPQDNGVGYSKKLFAPRFGFAYQVTSNTVIRSGYGITYHSHPWGAQALRGWYPLTIVGAYSMASTATNRSPRTPITWRRVSRTHRSAPMSVFRRSAAPTSARAGQPLPLSAEMGYPVANQELHRGYIQSWNLIVEHKLPGEMVTSVGYVGIDIRQTASRSCNINASQIPGSGDDGRPLFAKFGRTATTREWDGRTHSNYHSLQATLNRRFTSGLFLKGAYTYSHAIDEAEYC